MIAKMWLILSVFVCCVLAEELIAPSWKHSSAEVTVYVGLNKPAIISCNIVGEHLTNFTWVDVHGRVIENSQLWWKNETHGTMELHIKSVTLDDYGIYTCRKTEFNYTYYDLVDLQPFPPDIFWIVEVHTPESIGITWNFDGFPCDKWVTLRIEYRQKGTLQWLPDLRFSTPEENPSTGSFTIEALKPNTVYEVKAEITVTVQPWSIVRRFVFLEWATTFVPREINNRATTVIGELNGRAVLSCDVTGEEITELTWRNLDTNYEMKSTNVWSDNKTGVRMELEIANVTSDDDGSYECHARSSGQPLTTIIRLEVIEYNYSPVKIGAIGTDCIYIILNYTDFFVNSDNLEVILFINYKESGTNEWYKIERTFDPYLGPATGYYIIKELKNGTLYQIENVVWMYNPEFIDRQYIFVLSKWATTFEKDVEYVPTVRIVDETMDTITIKWSQPPPELRESIDAYLISVVNGTDEEKHFRWQKYKAADGDEAVLHLQPAVSYGLQVEACFNDYCPEQYESDVMKVVMSNDTGTKEHSRARRESESDTESSVLTMKVTRDSKNTTAGSNASFSCSVSVHGYEGWWTVKNNETYKYVGISDDEADWTIIVDYAEEGNIRDYTCVATKTNDSHSGGTMHVTLILPSERTSAEAEIVYAKPLESTALLCDAFGYRLSDFKWRKVWNGYTSKLRGVSSTSSFNKTHTRMMLYFANTSNLDAGKYRCGATNSRLNNIVDYVQLYVSDEPTLQFNASIIGTKLVYLRWLDVRIRGDRYLIRSSEEGFLKWRDEFSVEVEDRKKYNGYVARQLTLGTSYLFEIVVISKGRRLASTYSRWITPTEKDVLYSPNITVISKTTNSVIIEWPMPPEKLRAHVKVYRIRVNSTLGGSEIVDIQHITQNHWTIEKLQPSTSYDLEVKACFDDVSTDCYSSDVREGVSTKSIDEESRRYVGTWLPLTGIFILLIGLGAWHFYKEVRKRMLLRERRADFYSGNPIYFNPELAISDQADLLPYEKRWEFPRKLLRLGHFFYCIDDELGSGSFGIVWKASAKTIHRPEAISVVAVKTVRPTASLRCMKALLRELKILIYIGHHPNIVSLLGACTKNLHYGQLLVIVEFCRFGNLHDYLWRCRSKFVDELDADSEEIHGSNYNADLTDLKIHSTSSEFRQEDVIPKLDQSCDSTVQPSTSQRAEDLSTGGDSQLPEVEPSSKYPGDFTNADLDPVHTQDLVSWAWQISRGMQFLASKKVLHGDLAARNILLCEDNIVKICDFGLSKSLQDDDDYKDEGNDPLPVKWMAIESIRDGIFSVKSDVWSFGVVLWELFSLAKTPYPEINPANMCETLLGGYRMERPKYSPKSIYRTMLRCWEANPSKRPTFVDLERSIGDLMTEHVKLHYIELYTRCSRVYAEITEFRNTRDPENQEPISPDPTDPNNVSQDQPTENPAFWTRVRQFLRCG